MGALTFRIRHAAADDRNRWLPLWAGYNASYGRFGPTARRRDVMEMTWQRLLAADEPIHALVAEAAGEVIGLTHYLFHSDVYWQTHQTNTVARSLYDKVAGRSGFMIYQRALS